MKAVILAGELGTRLSEEPATDPGFEISSGNIAELFGRTQSQRSCVLNVSESVSVRVRLRPDSPTNYVMIRKTEIIKAIYVLTSGAFRTQFGMIWSIWKPGRFDYVAFAV
jgi:hypothetical protein